MGGCAWQRGACMVKGECVWQRGHALWRGACMVKAGGHAWWREACVVKGCVCGRTDGHCSGQYASYWNAFLFKKIWRTYVLFMGPLISLFWTSGDVSYGFQSLSLQLYLCLTEAYVSHVPWDSRLVGHMLTSWSGMNLIKFCPSVSNSKETGCVPLILCKWCT